MNNKLLNEYIKKKKKKIGGIVFWLVLEMIQL